MSDEPKPVLTINTLLSLPLVKVIGSAVVLLTAGWFAKDYANKLTQSVADLSREVSSLRVDLRGELDRRTFGVWTRTDHRLWSYELHRVNNGSLKIPDMSATTTPNP